MMSVESTQLFFFKKKINLNSKHTKIVGLYFCKNIKNQCFCKKTILYSFPGYTFFKKNVEKNNIFFLKKITFKQFFLRKMTFRITKKFTKKKTTNPYFFFKFQEYMQTRLYCFKNIFGYKSDLKKNHNNYILDQDGRYFSKKRIPCTPILLFKKEKRLCFTFLCFLIFFLKKETCIAKITWSCFFLILMVKIFFFDFFKKKTDFFLKKEYIKIIFKKKLKNVLLILCVFWNGILRASYFFSV